MLFPLKTKYDYTFFIRHSLLFLSFLIVNNIERQVLPYSTAVLFCGMVSGTNRILSPILFILSFFTVGQTDLLLSASIPALTVTAISFIFGKNRKDYKFVYVLLSGVSLLGFIFLYENISLEKRIIVSLITIVLTYVFIDALQTVVKKGLKFKPTINESVSVAITVIAFGLGLSNCLSPLVYKACAVFLALVLSYIFSSAKPLVFSAVLSVPFAIFYNQLNFVSVFILWNISALMLMSVSRYVSALSVIFIDYILQVFFNIYQIDVILQIIAVTVGAVAFILIPTKVLSRVKEKLYSFREKQLVRSSINSNRTMISNRLYDLSGVFLEMAEQFSVLKKERTDKETVKKQMVNSLKKDVCTLCPTYANCKGSIPDDEFLKLIDIGLAKGKLSLIDVSSAMLKYCIHPNNVIFGVNKNLEKYRRLALEEENYIAGRQIIADQSKGVSEMLCNLAREEGALLKFQSRTERLLSETLFSKGITVSEMLIYGDQPEVSMIVEMKEIPLKTICDTVSEVLSVNMTMEEKWDISADKCYILLRKSPPFDAVFGISGAVKENSACSGDTHSVTRISRDKFLVALSDGMGSGERARKVSGASLSLIESFYKAGLSSSLILGSVNKLLSINLEDSFTALDVSVINLSDCTADFIKYGSPYTFIIGESGIRIVEGNTLPLGIVDKLTPEVCTAELNDGDMLLLMTDGVSDAFGSCSEVIEFLKTLPAMNPQYLTDRIVSKAVEKSGKKDDITALAVRIFKPDKSMDIA